MRFVRDDFTFSKRILGLVLFIGGGLGAVGLLLLDAITGSAGGVGPAQRLALVLMIVAALLGATLIPLGDDPA